MKEIASYVFDFDGTLADTRDGVVSTVNAVLAEMNLPAVAPQAVQAQIGLPLRETFIRGAHVTDDAVVARCVALYRSLFETVGAPEVKLFPHAKEVLATLHENGATLSVASSRGRKSLDPLLDRLGIGGFLTIALGEEDVEHGKPAPDLVLKILAETRASAESALVIGDTVWDIRMGRAAHCRTCAVLWGNAARAQLEAQHPDFLASAFPDILAIAAGGRPAADA